MLSKPNLLLSILLIALYLQPVITVNLERGNILIKIIEENKDTIQFKVNLNSRAPSTLELTQNSKVKLEANVSHSLLSSNSHNKSSNLNSYHSDSNMLSTKISQNQFLPRMKAKATSITPLLISEIQYFCIYSETNQAILW